MVLVVCWGFLEREWRHPDHLVLPLLALPILPVMTFVWTYVRLLIGLDRLGRARLALEPFPQDRSLGLGAVGSLAFSGFGLLVAAACPVLIATTRNPTTFFITVVILAISLPTFFLSMWRLHRPDERSQGANVARRARSTPRHTSPFELSPSLSVLRAQAQVLDSARALEERAQRIQAWPLDEWLIAIIGFVVAGVTSGIVVRFIVVAAHL